MQVSLSKKEIKKGDVVLDIGAHIGYYTIIFSELVGSTGKVYAFEPLPKNFQLLKKTVETNNLTNVEIFQNIVSDKNETLDFYTSKLDSVGNRMYNSDEAASKIEINSISIDEFLKNKSNKVDFVKMDIQGAEVLAIDGMKETLQNNKKLKIIQEWWPEAIKKYDRIPDSHLNFLEKLGFIFYVVDETYDKLTPITVSKLMKTYPNDNLEDVNLFCVNEKSI
jgi:FkbM family methyltransferase